LGRERVPREQEEQHGLVVEKGERENKTNDMLGEEQA
jgi:hypothetical protein